MKSAEKVENQKNMTSFGWSIELVGSHLIRGGIDPHPVVADAVSKRLLFSCQKLFSGIFFFLGEKTKEIKVWMLLQPLQPLTEHWDTMSTNCCCRLNQCFVSGDVEESGFTEFSIQANSSWHPFMPLSLSLASKLTLSEQFSPRWMFVRSLREPKVQRRTCPGF